MSLTKMIIPWFSSDSVGVLQLTFPGLAELPLLLSMSDLSAFRVTKISLTKFLLEAADEEL